MSSLEVVYPYPVVLAFVVPDESKEESGDLWASISEDTVRGSREGWRRELEALPLALSHCYWALLRETLSRLIRLMFC